MDEKNNQLNVFKTVAEFSSDWLMWLAVNTTIKYISPAVETITGYKPQEFIEDASLFKQLIHPVDKEHILKEFKKPHSCSIEFRIIHKDGSVRWIAHSCRPVFDETNKITGRVSSNRDITNRKLAESALKKKEKFLQSIIDGIQDPMHVIDRDYKVLLTNKKLLEMKNVNQEDIRGEFCYEAYQGINKHCEQCAAKEVFETGKPHSLIKTLPLPDGSYSYFEVFAFPLFEENGDVTQVIEITRDITSREIAVQNMLKMTRIVEQSAEAVAITDIEGNIEYVNSAFEKITGYSLDEAKEIKPRLLKSGEHTPEFYKEIWDTITKGNIWRGPFKNKNNKGRIYYEDAVIFPIKDESGKIINYAKIARDITELKKAENSLREQEELLRTLINSTPDIICFKDGQGRWLEANDADLKLFQLDNVDYRGKKDSELAKYSDFYYEAFMTCEASDEIAWQKGEISRGVEIIPKPDGSENVYEVIKAPLFESDGSRKGLIVFGRDITEMKKAEKALKQSEEKYRKTSLLYRLMADNMPDLIWAKDLEGKFLFTNKAICEKLLIAKDTNEPIGKNDLFFAERQRRLHPERTDWHTFGELCQNSDEIVIKTKKAQRFDEYGNVKGKFLYLDVYKAPIFNSDGEIIGTVGHGRIVTKEKETEKKLIESEKRYRRIFEDSQDVIFVSSTEGRFLDLNPAGLKLFGYSSLAEIQKINIAKELYMNPSDRLEYIKKIQADGFVNDYEIHVKKKNGSEITALETTTAIYDKNNKIIACRGIMRDITEKQKLEKQLAQAQKLEAVGIMVGGISHELNNILQSIFLYGGLVQENLPAEQEIQINMKHLLENGERARDIVKQILTFSRKSKVDIKPQPLYKLVLEALSLAQASFPPNIEIKQNIDITGDLVLCNKTQIHQIMLNLCNNAEDAMREKGGILSVSLKNIHKSIRDGDPATDAIALTISDTGHGIDPADLERIFDPFFTTKQFGQGTGLGLSVIHGIVNMIDGHISVTSEVDKGTTFKILLPVVINAVANSRTI